MPLPCYCVDLRRYDFRGDYSTDKKLNEIIATLVDDILVEAAAEDVTERILHEAVLKTKGGLHVRKFTMTSKKPPETSSDDEGPTDNEADAPPGDTSILHEISRFVDTITPKDVEDSVVSGETVSLEEEIKNFILQISTCEGKPSPSKAVTEGQGDAELVEAVPEDQGEIYESPATPDLLLENSSSEEWIHQERKEDIAAWEESVEVEVQVIEPDYEDEDNPVYCWENDAPHTSSSVGFSDGTAVVEETGPHELQHQKHVDTFSTRTVSDELEFETLAFCTSIVVDIMSRVEETIVAIETNKHHIEANVENTVPNCQINETSEHDERNDETLASKQPLTELENAQITTPIISITKPTMPEPICGRISNEEPGEDPYGIESMKFDEKNEETLSSKQALTELENAQITTPIISITKLTMPEPICGQIANEEPEEDLHDIESMKYDENKGTLSSKQALTELEKTHITTPIISITNPSTPEPICGQISNEEPEEDLYDIESMKCDEKNEETLSSKQALSEFEKTQITTPIISVTKPSTLEPICGQISNEEPEEDLYDIESIKCDQKNEETLSSKQALSEFEKTQITTPIINVTKPSTPEPNCGQISNEEPEEDLYDIESMKSDEKNEETLSSKQALSEFEKTQITAPIISITNPSTLEPICGQISNEEPEEDLHDIESVKCDEKTEETLGSKQDLKELGEAQISTPKMSITTFSMPEPMYGQKSKEESEEEDLYDIESINIHSEDILKLNTQGTPAVSDSQTNPQRVPSSGCQNESSDHGLETMTHANFLPADSEYLEAEHLEYFNSNYKMANKVQSYDDILVRAAEQSDNTILPDNISERAEVPHTASVGSLDHHKNTESEKIKYQSGQREVLQLSTILKEDDSEENTLSVNFEITEHELATSTTSKVDQDRESENGTQIANTLAEKESSVTVIIKTNLEPTEIASTEKLECTTTQSSQGIMQATSQTIEEGKQKCEGSRKYLETNFRSTLRPRPSRRSLRATPKRKHCRHCTSERKTRADGEQKSSSNQHEGDAKEKNDVECNVCFQERSTDVETSNGKRWNFTSRMKKLFSYMKRKL